MERHLARINFESRFLADPRFRLLVKLVGDEDKALGMCVRAWFLAQKYWTDDRSLIPERIWQASGLEPLVAADLAEVRAEQNRTSSSGIYCRGAETQFEWLVKSNRSEAGKKSAEARRKKYGTALPAGASNLVRKRRTKPNKTPNTTELVVRSCSEQDPNRTELSLLPTLCSEIAKDEALTPKAGDVWSAYVTSYRARYQEPPVRNAKQMGMCAQLVKRLGGDAAVSVVRYYLTHQNAYYVQKSHALGPCLLDCEGLHTQMKTGMAVTRSSASHADKGAANKAAFDAVAAKWAAEGKLKGGTDGE
jgi:hypothetical protein